MTAWNDALAERDRLVAELAEASTSQLVQERIAQANLRLFAESQAERDRLRAALVRCARWMNEHIACRQR